MKALSVFFNVLAIGSYIVILTVLIVAAPILFGFRPVVVLTGSMEPALSVGSVIYYKEAGFEEIQSGDIITFDLNDDSDTVITHRVTSVDENLRAFETKGDANASADGNLIYYQYVKGKVIDYKLPFVGFLVKYIQNIYLIIGIVAILLGKMVVDKVQDSREPEKEVQRENNAS